MSSMYVCSPWYVWFRRMSEGVRREEYDEYENWYSVDVLQSCVGCGPAFNCFVLDPVWC